MWQKSDVKKKFGASVRSARNLLGLSQEALAERANLHRTYVSDVERGSRNISLENIQKLALALNLSVSALFPSGEQMLAHASPLPGHEHDAKLVDILLVEDSPEDAELTLDAFKKARFTNRVEVVTDGETALDYLFCEGKFTGRPANASQIILLDFKLPKMDGLEVLRRLKLDKRTRLIPVVILAMSAEQCDMDDCRRMGAESYIVKPVNFQRLSQATPFLDLNWALVKPLKESGAVLKQ